MDSPNDQSLIKRFWDFIASPTYRRTLSVLAVLTIAAAIPLTSYIAQQRQDLRQRAAGQCLEPAPSAPYPCERGTDQVRDGQPVGRCSQQLPGGGYETAYAHYSYTEDGTNDGDGIADPQNPNDQPYCINVCAAPTQCAPEPTAPPSTPISVSGRQGDCVGTQGQAEISWSWSGGSGSYTKLALTDTTSGGSQDFNPTPNNQTSMSNTVNGGHNFRLQVFDNAGRSGTSGTVASKTCTTPQATPTVQPTLGADCESIKINGLPFSSFPGALINTQYTATIRMQNTVRGGFSSPWQPNYSLRYVGADRSALNLSLTQLPVEQTVNSGGSKDFSVTFRSPNPSPNEDGFAFTWIMHDNQGTPFGGACNIKIEVFTTLPGTTPPGPTSTPDPESPTNTPTPRPTRTPTPSPTNDPDGPTPTPSPTGQPPTPTPTPTPTTPAGPTATPVPGSIVLAFTFTLEGVDPNPRTPTRQIQVFVDKNQTDLTPTTTGEVMYDAATKTFIGTAVLAPNTVAAGTHSVKVKTDRHLRKTVAAALNITPGVTFYTIPQATLTVGDINGDNTTDVEDWNILRDCYGNKRSTSSCSATNRIRANLNDDRVIDGVDINWFIKNFNTNGD